MTGKKMNWHKINSEALLGRIKLISINEACELLGISRPTIYRIIKNGTLTLVKIGRRSLLSLSELQSYVENLKYVSNEKASKTSRGL